MVVILPTYWDPILQVALKVGLLNAPKGSRIVGPFAVENEASFTSPSRQGLMPKSSVWSASLVLCPGGVEKGEVLIGIGGKHGKTPKMKGCGQEKEIMYTKNEDSSAYLCCELIHWLDQLPSFLYEKKKDLNIIQKIDTTPTPFTNIRITTFLSYYLTVPFLNRPILLLVVPFPRTVCHQLPSLVENNLRFKVGGSPPKNSRREPGNDGWKPSPESPNFQGAPHFQVNHVCFGGCSYSFPDFRHFCLFVCFEVMFCFFFCGEEGG